jgi:hypothetical protein
MVAPSESRLFITKTRNYENTKKDSENGGSAPAPAIGTPE